MIATTVNSFSFFFIFFTAIYFCKGVYQSYFFTHSTAFPRIELTSFISLFPNSLFNKTALVSSQGNLIVCCLLKQPTYAKWRIELFIWGVKVNWQQVCFVGDCLSSRKDLRRAKKKWVESYLGFVIKIKRR